MVDMKKFLDAEGVRYLWSKINMNDYPNNEVLMAVINAIDETKADKSELNTGNIVQGDEALLLATLINTYLLDIDYSLLVFNTSDIVFDNISDISSILGQAILG